jgi:hypothetical protein
MRRQALPYVRVANLELADVSLEGVDGALGAQLANLLSFRGIERRSIRNTTEVWQQKLVSMSKHLALCFLG